MTIVFPAMGPDDKFLGNKKEEDMETYSGG